MVRLELLILGGAVDVASIASLLSTTSTFCFLGLVAGLGGFEAALLLFWDNFRPFAALQASC